MARYPSRGCAVAQGHGTLIEIDRVAARKENGHHLWYSGKHKSHGGNV